MKIYNDLSQISAEMLLNYLYPELGDQWTARFAGTFYRNYTNDSLSVYEETKEVVLARDGFLKLLPESLIFDEDELKGGGFSDKYQKLEARQKLFREAFLPLDTIAFRQKLQLEREASALLEMKLGYVLKTIFGFDLAAEQNPYVREVAGLLPFVSKLRADFDSIARLLETLLDCRVEMSTGRYSHEDSTRYWVPSLRYELFIPGLSAEEYRKLYADITPLAAFIKEWFIPAEVHCKICIKEHWLDQRVNTRLTLDYNTAVKSEE